MGVGGERLAIMLGVLCVAAALTVFASCRTCIRFLSWVGIKNIGKSKRYQIFNRYHVWYWWAFGMLVVLHAGLAIAHTGLPQAGDSDAPVHARIIGYGLLSTLLGGATFSTCRVCLPLFFRQATFKNKALNFIYSKTHAYIWAVVALAIVAHFYFAYEHAGIWPNMG
ncbi:MAG TPA: hypothetical protein VMB24_01035 [Dehalococcoidales bacterium]|nr:hypothetical protein [Dehalococcoidales bacterium]